MAKQFIKKKPRRRKIILSTEFVTSLAKIKIYGEETFGKTVSNRFISEARHKISLLSQQPNSHPKNRFIESTENNFLKYFLGDRETER